MDDLQKTLALEEIKLLKARYWRGVDTQDRALLRSVFSDDARIPAQGNPALVRNVDEFVDNIIKSLSGAVSSHLGGSPEISFTSDDEATGIWAMQDRIWAPEGAAFPFRTLFGWGHYHDVYRKTAQGWKIQSFVLVRLREEIT